MIYLDYNATTPVLPEVFEAMRPHFCDDWGNPSSAYRFGAEQKKAIEVARENVGSLIGADKDEILFTSCATESNNCAIASALATVPEKRQLITSSVEHSSVLMHCKVLEKRGYEVTYLPVDSEGLINIVDLKRAISPNTALVTLHWANNETGVIFPVEEISSLCQDGGVLFHCDAVQAAARIKINLKKVAIDYLSISGHKFYAPKGIGALYIRRLTPFIPFLVGGHQEKGRRGGTESVPLIVGMGKAAELAKVQLADLDVKLRPLRDKLESKIEQIIARAEVNGHRVKRLYNTSNVSGDLAASC